MTNGEYLTMLVICSVGAVYMLICASMSVSGVGSVLFGAIFGVLTYIAVYCYGKLRPSQRRNKSNF